MGVCQFVIVVMLAFLWSEGRNFAAGVKADLIGSSKSSGSPDIAGRWYRYSQIVVRRVDWLATSATSRRSASQLQWFTESESGAA